MPPVIKKELCSSCGVCADICPEDVLALEKNDDIPRVVYPKECWHCAACVIGCRLKAIDLYIPLPMRL